MVKINLCISGMLFIFVLNKACGVTLAQFNPGANDNLAQAVVVSGITENLTGINILSRVSMGALILR